jgi:hypothetical protein
VNRLEVLDPAELGLEDPDDFHPCSASHHPLHDECGQRAVYVIVSKCPVCELRPRYLCPPHCTQFLPAYISNGPWCSCGEPHESPHDIIDVRVQGL